MTKPSRILVLPLLLSACVVSNPYEGGDTFDTVTTTNSGGMTETGTSGSTGDGDGDPATGDGDGDPTTSGDGDGDPTTTGDGDGDSTGDGDGDPTTSGDGDGDPTTTGDGDGDPPPACNRRRWRYDFDNDSWSSVTLDSVWAGANAPPCDVEIWGTTYLEPSDQLLVFAANGMYYRQKNNSWSAPADIDAVFPELGNNEIESIIHVPALEGEDSQILINSLPNAYLYDIAPNGGVTHFDTVAIEDEPPPGPVQSELVRTWSLSFGDAELLGQDADWWNSWQRFEDNRVYRVDGGFSWQNWGQNSSPMFDGNDSPNPATIEAAWGTYSPNRGYLIGF